MNEAEYKELVEKLGKDVADQIQKQAKIIEDTLNAKHADLVKGLLTKEQFDELKKELTENELKGINDQLAKLEAIAKTQGEVLNVMKEHSSGTTKKKSLGDYLEENIAKIAEFRKAGSGFIEVTGAQLKAAGITSIGNSIQAMDNPPDSPYAPGLGGAELELFDIVRNPNFILNRVDVGRTNQSRLAWINETDYQGTPAEVDEGGNKPLTQHKFKVELSEAKKAAAYIELTEEFEDDVPGLATAVRRMLQTDVIRAFDDAVQAAVIAAARPYEITGLDDSISDANQWDALGAELAQIAKYNFVANTVALNPVTMWKIWMQKDNEGRYLTPPFQSIIDSKRVEATKVAEGFGLVGDLTQFKVDIYKDFVLKMGWINDNFIQNKFCIVGEIRYHRYISDNRKKAIVYDNLNDIEAQIDGGGSI